MFDNILERKKAFLDSKITKISQQNLFDIILESQKAFLDYKKTEISKSRKIKIFPKGLVHGFGQKFEIFHVFIFCKISHQNVFDIILESQKTFLDYKKWKVKKVENSGFFPRGLVHGFGKKFEFFFIFLS